MRKAVSLNAYSIVQAHNHPVGGTSPSKADLETTELLYRSCEVLNINFLDHVIISSAEKPYSFSKNGKLKQYGKNCQIAEDILTPDTFANTAYRVVEKFCEDAKRYGAEGYSTIEAAKRLAKTYIKFFDPIV